MSVFRRFLKQPAAVAAGLFLLLLLVLALTADLWIDEELVIGQHLSEKLQHPSRAHLFGTDELGRDLFCRVLYGTRYSLLIGISATLLSLALGVPLGVLAGYFGRSLDTLIMRLTDIFSALPAILTSLAVVAVLGASPVNLVLAVGLAAVPLFVRVTRAAVLTAREESFVEASLSLGAGNRHVILTHILPHALPSVMVQATLRVGTAIISAASLSFLGLGLGAPLPEWGALLSSGRNFIRGYGYLCFFPGLFIFLTVLALNLVGDGLQEALEQGK